MQCIADFSDNHLHPVHKGTVFGDKECSALFCFLGTRYISSCIRSASCLAHFCIHTPFFRTGFTVSEPSSNTSIFFRQPACFGNSELTQYHQIALDRIVEWLLLVTFCKVGAGRSILTAGLWALIFVEAFSRLSFSPKSFMSHVAMRKFVVPMCVDSALENR